MHKVMMEIEKMTKAKETLMCWLEQAMSCGIENFDTDWPGDVTDMIKDLSEASEKCVKAKYYECLIRSMMNDENMEEEDGPFGYDHWRYSSGRFAPKGSGHYSAGYTPRLHQSDMRMETPEITGRNSRYGYSYDEYQDAKTRFKDSKSKEDKDMMHQKMKHAMGDIGMIFREMYDDADPDTQKELKMHLATILDEAGMKK